MNTINNHLENKHLGLPAQIICCTNKSQLVNITANKEGKKDLWS